MKTFRMQLAASLSLCLALGLTACGDNGHTDLFSTESDEDAEIYDDDPNGDVASTRLATKTGNQDQDEEEEDETRTLTGNGSSTTGSGSGTGSGATTPPPTTATVQKTCGCYNTKTKRFSTVPTFISPSPSKAAFRASCRPKPAAGCASLNNTAKCLIDDPTGAITGSACPARSDLYGDQKTHGLSCGSGYRVEAPGALARGKIYMHQFGHEWRETTCATQPNQN